MKKVILGLTAFLMATITTSAMTKQEQIQGELSKLGVSQEIINETIAIDKEIGDGIRVREGAKYRQYLKTLLSKDFRNFIVADSLIVDDMLRNVETLENEKIFVEMYKRYVPYAHEKDYAEYSYLIKSGQIPQANMKMDEIIQKYKGTWVEKWSLVGKTKNYDELVKVYQETLDLMKIAKNNNEMGVTEESYYDFKLMYDDIVLSNYASKKEVKKAVDYYIKNVGNDMEVSESVLVYYKNVLKNTFNGIAALNDTLENKTQREKNKEKLKKTRVFKMLQKHFPVNY